jgi:hypothetical protein
MKPIQKLDEWADKIFDYFDHKSELKKWNKLIKKACKKHYIKNKQLIQMYLSIQKDVLSKFNKKIKEGIQEKNNFEDTPFNTIIIQKIYDLNREFILLVNGEFHNSAFALTRQIIEIYIRLIQCRYDRNLIKKLIEEKRQKSPIKNTIENLKKEATFSYVKGVDSKKFLDSTLNWFEHFSNLFHLSGIGLSQNMWVFNEDTNLTRFYIQDPNLKEGEKLIIFSKKAAVQKEQYFELIHQFYTFTDGCLKELKLLGVKYEIN